MLIMHFPLGTHSVSPYRNFSLPTLQIMSCVNLMQPVFLKALVDFTLTDPDSASLAYGITLCASLVAVATLASLTSNHYNLRMSRLGIRIRGGLCMLVYEKARSTPVYHASLGLLCLEGRLHLIGIEALKSPCRCPCAAASFAAGHETASRGARRAW